MSLFRLDASIRVEGSHSRAIADIVEQEWRNAHPDEPVVRRHVGVDLAHQLRQEAEEQARRHGRELGAATAAALAA